MGLSPPGAGFSVRLVSLLEGELRISRRGLPRAELRIAGQAILEETAHISQSSLRRTTDTKLDARLGGGCHFSPPSAENYETMGSPPRSWSSERARARVPDQELMGLAT